MKANLPHTVRNVADFIGIELDDELFEIVLKHSSYEFMKAHKGQFNDVMMRELSEKNCGIPPGGDASKVRAGQTGAHKQELPRDVGTMLDIIWQQEIGKQFGLKTHEDMLAALIVGG